MDVPVVFIIYNRPDLTARVFESIRAQEPRHLYVIADGPKSASDADCVEQTRRLIQPDWECELVRDYSDLNLGCQERIFSGLSAAFLKYQRAIILEDDCLPNADFFKFCQDALDLYSEDSKVCHVSGTNFLEPGLFKGSHAMTQYPTPWGWATWRRSWQEMDLSMESFFGNEQVIQKRSGVSRRAWRKLVKRLRKVYSGELKSWAYPWLATCLGMNRLVVTPKQNLVSNIGFDCRSTNTSNPKSFFANRPSKAFGFPLDHDIGVSLDAKLNRALFDLIFGSSYRKKSFFRKLFG